MSLFYTHRGFLQSLLREANARRRNVTLDLAKKYQFINALSEMVFNAMKQNVPIQPKTIQKLKCYKNVLQALRLRQTSLKRKRKQLKKQTGRAFWQGFNECFCLGRDDQGFPTKGIDVVP